MTYTIKDAYAYGYIAGLIESAAGYLDYCLLPCQIRQRF